VRFGPWARNLYLGLPAAFTFGVISFAAQMPPPMFYAWNLVVAVLVVICAFTRELRFYPDGSIVSATRFLALLPVRWCRYQRSALRQVRLEGASIQVGDSDEISADTVWLVLASGRRIPIQSYSDEAENTPPLHQLLRDLRAITTLDIL
jgi:hypothetical protein